MSSRPPSHPTGASRETTAQTARHARGLITKAVTYFAVHEKDNLSKVRDRLLQLLDAGQPLQRAQYLRSAYTLLGKHAETFFGAYRSALQTALEGEIADSLPYTANFGFQKTTISQPLDGMSFSLIDVGEVDRIMLVDRIARKFLARYDGDLQPLTQRMAALYGQDSLAVSGNPFRPDVFVRAFMQAWEKTELDEQATEELIASLEPAFFVDLAPLYKDLNATLVHAGVAAQTTYRIRKSVEGASNFASLGGGSAPAPLSRDSEMGGGPASDFGALQTGSGNRSAWSGLAPMGRSVATQARQFLRRLGIGGPAAAAGQAGGQGGTAGGAPAPGGHAGDGVPWTEGGEGNDMPHAVQEAPDAEFLGYLGDLQAGAGAASRFQFIEGQDPAEHNILRQMRESEEVRRAPELDRGTVDALAEVFDYVFADQSIPLQMKYVIGRLQIPVLKAAMIDRDFFLSAEHPARRLVDTLASASVAWAPEKGEDDPLYVRIEHTVQRVLNEFEDDLALFSDLLADFAEFLFETEQQAQGRIEPVVVKELDSESFDQALAHVDEVVHGRIAALPADSPAVRFLAPFLTHQWREVMARAWVASADDTAPWEMTIKTMDQLIWSIQPKTTSQERRDLVAILPELVRSLNSGLDVIEWGGEDRASFTRRLIETHMMAIRMTQPAAKDVRQAAAEAAADDAAAQVAIKELDERRASKLSSSVDEYDAMAQSFTRGLWFEFTLDDSTKHRCRLSWVSPMRTRLLFTNREGFDAFVRSEREVAELLRRGHLTVIDQEPVVGRALDWLMASAS